MALSWLWPVGCRSFATVEAGEDVDKGRLFFFWGQVFSPRFAEISLRKTSMLPAISKASRAPNQIAVWRQNKMILRPGLSGSKKSKFTLSTLHRSMTKPSTQIKNPVTKQMVGSSSR